MNEESKRNDNAVARVQTASHGIFGGPLSFRASFLLTILFDLSLIALAVTLGAVVGGM